MEQIQSYYSAMVKHRFTTYEVRLLLKIVNQSQIYLCGKGKYKDIMKGLRMNGRNLDFAFAVKDIAGNTHNYAPLKEALDGLQNLYVEYWDSDKRIYRKSSIIFNVEIQEQSGIIKCSAAEWFINYMLDFKNGGVRVYDFEKAMSLKSVYATRMYMIVSSLNKGISYRYKEFREVLGLGDKYKRLNDFCKKVMDVARDELEKKGMNGFRYKLVKEVDGHKGAEVRRIEIYPVKRELKDRDISKQIGEFKIPDMIKQYLSIQMDFTGRELASFAPFLDKFCRLEKWQDKFFEIVDRTRRLGKNHGYLIQAVKNETILSD